MRHKSEKAIIIASWSTASITAAWAVVPYWFANVDTSNTEASFQQYADACVAIGINAATVIQNSYPVFKEMLMAAHDMRCTKSTEDCGKSVKKAAKAIGFEIVSLAISGMASSIYVDIAKDTPFYQNPYVIASLYFANVFWHNNGTKYLLRSSLNRGNELYHDIAAACFAKAAVYRLSHNLYKTTELQLRRRQRAITRFGFDIKKIDMSLLNNDSIAIECKIQHLFEVSPQHPHREFALSLLLPMIKSTLLLTVCAAISPLFINLFTTDPLSLGIFSTAIIANFGLLNFVVDQYSQQFSEFLIYGHLPSLLFKGDESKAAHIGRIIGYGFSMAVSCAISYYSVGTVHELFNRVIEPFVDNQAVLAIAIATEYIGTMLFNTYGLTALATTAFNNFIKSTHPTFLARDAASKVIDNYLAKIKQAPRELTQQTDFKLSNTQRLFLQQNSQQVEKCNVAIQQARKTQCHWLLEIALFKFAPLAASAALIQTTDSTEPYLPTHLAPFLVAHFSRFIYQCCQQKPKEKNSLEQQLHEALTSQSGDEHDCESAQTSSSKQSDDFSCHLWTQQLLNLLLPTLGGVGVMQIVLMLLTSIIPANSGNQTTRYATTGGADIYNNVDTTAADYSSAATAFLLS